MMPMTDNEIRDVALALLEAEKTRKPMVQPSKRWPDMKLDDSYRVQQVWAEERVNAGARAVGHKIGLTSRAMQMASKMNEPDYGVLLDDMLYVDGASIPASRFH